MTLDTTARTGMPAAFARKRVEVAILVCMCTVYFFAYFQRVAVPGTIFDELLADFHTSATTIALLAGMYLYLYGGMQLFVGVMTDRFGALRMLLAGGLLLALGALAFPLSRSLPMLFVTRALVGVGDSLIFLSIVKGVDLLFSAVYFPQVLAIAQAVGNTGGLAATFPCERAVALWGWRDTLVAVGVLLALAWLVSLVLFRATGRLGGPRHAAASLMLGTIVRNRPAWPLLIAGPLNFGVYFLIQATIGKKFLTDYCGISSAAAAGFTFLMMLATIVIGILGAFLARALGDRRRPFILLSLAMTGVGVLTLFVALLLGLPAGWFLAGFLLMGMSAIGSALGNAVMKELNPPGAVGSAIGVLNCGCYVVVALLTNAAGFIMDHFWRGDFTAAGAKLYPKDAYAAIFLLCLCLAAAAFASALALRETHGRSVYAEDALTT